MDHREDSLNPAEDAVASRKVGRREVIAVMGAASMAVVLGCADSPTSPTSGGSTSGGTTGGSTNSACAVTPTETVGPYPSLTDLFRSDVREDRVGTRLNLTIKVVNVNASCAPVSGVNVEIWHVDAAGVYSQYGSGSGRTFLRGIQTTDANGQVTFATIFPGWYQGRATHIHAEATRNGTSLKATQIAFPETVNNTVHTQGVYQSRGINPMSNAADGIFADSLSSELVTPIGDVAAGYDVTIQMGIAV